MNLNHRVNDLPEDGLVIIGPSHPAFDAEMAALLRGADEALTAQAMSFRHLYAFLRNDSVQEVVAYKLMWELTDADGRVRKKASSFLAPAKLLGEESPAGGITSGIKPGTSHPVAWDRVFDKMLLSDLNSPSGATILSRVGAIFAEQNAAVTGVTVSLDGAFFADGSFVGPDTDHTFEEVSGYVEAKHELARVAAAKKREGKSAREIVEHIKSAYPDAADARGVTTSPAGVKKFFMRQHVNELVSASNVMGDEQAVARVLFRHRPGRVTLHRKAK